MALIEIEQDKNEQQGSSEAYSSLMTDRQRALGDRFSSLYMIRRAEIDTKHEEEWSAIEKLYECERDADAEDPDFPNNMIPILLPTIEGQVASMMESKIDFRHKSNNPAQRLYMKKMDAASEYYRRKSKYHAHMKDCTRSYETYGMGYVYIGWDNGYGSIKGQPKGYPKIEVCGVRDVLVDGSIKDPKDLQSARYIIHEIGNTPIMWAREEYGDELADSLLAGYSGTSNDDEDVSYDDQGTFLLLRVWYRKKDTHELQMLEMDANGLILRESNLDEPFYKYVCNEYPFGVVQMIPRMNDFYGFGDGKVLKPIQESINNLFDEWELAVRFSSQARTFVDPDARIAEGQMTSNPKDIVWAKNPRENILLAQSLGINPVVPQLVSALYDMAQKATRFHDTMTGANSGVSATATQINTQMNQGTVGIKDKKTDIARLMEWADSYALKLCLEKWDKPFWAALGADVSEYVDVDGLSQAPAAVPTTGAAIEAAVEAFRETGKRQTPDYFEVPSDENGEAVMTDLDFETEVIIGEALPQSRSDMYQILLSLAQVQILNKETQQVEPLITPNRLRQAMEDITGIPLKTQAEEFNEIKQEYVQNTLQAAQQAMQGGSMPTMGMQGQQTPGPSQPPMQ